MGENGSNLCFQKISVKTGVALRKIQSSYDLKIKPQTVPQPNVFPARKSSYIGHLRNQTFVNNMKLRFLKEDGSVPAKGLPRRSQSAPIFSARTLKTIQQQHPEEPQFERAKGRKCKSANHYRGGFSKSTDITNTGNRDGRESRSSGSFAVRRTLSARKYYGKVNIESGKNRTFPETNGDFFSVQGLGIKPPNVNESPGSYLSLLRKDLSKRPGSREANEKVKNSIHTQHDFVTRERLDYERQTDHLLQYYSKKVDSNRLEKYPERPQTVSERLCSSPRMNATPRNCKTSCSSALATVQQYNNKRNEYFINLKRHGVDGQYNGTNPHFILISRQAVLHDQRYSKSTRDQHVYDTINGFSKKCECSMCQSDLNLDTSRLTLAPDGNSSHSSRTSPVKKREYWVNPSGPLTEEIIARIRPNSPHNLDVNNDCSDESTVE